MFCKWCGLESETNDVCSWCRKPFSSQAAPAPQPPAPTTPRPGTQAPPALTESFDEEPPLPSNAHAAAPPSPSAAPTPRPAPTPFSAGEYDDIDDDLSPMPFGGSYQSPIARQVPAPGPVQRAVPPAYVPPPRPASLSPSFAPNVPNADEPPPAFTPPVSRPIEEKAAPAQESPETPPPVPEPVHTAPPPAPPAIMPHADSRPALEAIPIKLRTPGGAGAGATPIIPIKPSARPEPRAPSAPAVPAHTPPFTPPPAVQPPAFANSASLVDEAPPVPSAPLSRSAQPLGDELPVVESTSVPADLGLKPLGDVDEDEIAPIAAPGGHRLDLGTVHPSPQTAAAPAPLPPPLRAGTATAVPPRGGRTWECRWCGMQSENPDTCTWCRRDLRGAPASGKPAHVVMTRAPVKGRAPIKGPVRQPVPRPAGRSPEKRSEPLPDLLREATKAPAPASNGANGSAPQFGTFQPAKSKYYSEQVYDPVSGKHYNADTGETTDLPEQEHREPPEETNDRTQLAIYAGVFVAICFVSAFLASRIAADSLGAYFGILAVASFAAGVLLPVLRVVPWQKDDPEDVAWALGLIPLFGPFAGSMAYGVLIVVRSDYNPAIVGVFLASLILRIVIDLATGHPLNKLVPFAELSPAVLGAQIMPLITLAGWYAAEMFHKPDE